MKSFVVRGSLTGMIDIVGNIPGGYVRGRPLPMYGVTMTHVPQLRTQVAPAT